MIAHGFADAVNLRGVSWRVASWLGHFHRSCSASSSGRPAVIPHSLGPLSARPLGARDDGQRASGGSGWHDSGDEHNPAAGRLFERLGSRCEPRLVEADWFRGEWTSVRIYAMLHR